ncbi:hypothetical protein ANN_14385 [Periplaneta americana]|uniref:Uncharacterized protein n=1 Tax=Periplaneta americana TaxID=6978 RepID=A0ABQ8SXK8_PERAM|nr:hypothetical protein ANN_14385 [Periplaneta americana]
MKARKLVQIVIAAIKNLQEPGCSTLRKIAEYISAWFLTVGSTLMRQLVTTLKRGVMYTTNVELKSSCDSLCLSFPEDFTKATIRNFREELRGREYESWKTLSGRGKGVEMYSEVTATNSWIANKKGLSTSEWISSLKMTANLAAVRSVPGRSLDGTRCRHGCPEIETLAHTSSYKIKIAAALRNKGWIVEEEISCPAENRSTRRVDILAYNADTKQGIIVDPTIRFEVECHQSAEVHLEKKSIYEPTVNYFKLKYALIHVEVLLYGCETWTLTLREEHRFRVFENKVLRKIFGAKRDEVTGEWRKLHNTELHALYSSPDIIRNIKSRRLRWAGPVARMSESRNAYRVLVGRPEGKRPLGRPRRRWEDNIKMDLREVGYDDRDWINLAQDRDRWRAYVRAAMNLRVP